MKNYIICNVSDQTIPVVLFINEMSSQIKIDNIFFLYTSYSCKKLDFIKEACPIFNSLYLEIELKEPDSLKSIKDTLSESFNEDKFRDAHFLVDITCGTKMMSIALFEYFKEFSAEIFYIYSQKESFRRIYPGNQRVETLFQYRIPLNSYLLAHGIALVNSGLLQYDIEFLNNVFDCCRKAKKVISKLHKDSKEILSKGKQNKSRPLFPVKNIDGLDDLCRSLNFTSEFLNFDQIKFITGGWFEQYIFAHLPDCLSLTSDLNCHLRRRDTQVENEFDVMFIYKNRLFIIEAKTSLQGTSSLANDTLYKSKALEKDFGLRTKTIIATLDSEIAGKKSFLFRAEIMEVALLLENDLIPESLSNNLQFLICNSS